MTELCAGELSAEWLGWLLAEFVTDHAGHRILIVEKSRPRFGYVQFLDGSCGFTAETVSNDCFDAFEAGREQRLSEAEEEYLVNMGWERPMYVASSSSQPTMGRKPNFWWHVSPGEAVGRAALLGARTLRELYGARNADELLYVFFEDNDACMHGRRPTGDRDAPLTS